MSSYLSEAFKKLSILNEEDFNIANIEDMEDAKSFMDMVDDEVEEVKITDVDAPTVDDLLDSYIGKAILDCCVCHSKLYKNPEDIHIDEEGTLANIDEECPYCFSTDGYKVIGVVAPFEEEIEVEEETEIEDEKEQDDSETKEVETKEKEEIEESLNESADISEYQKWVDFDMGKYHRISDITMDKIKKAGLSVVKDQYGDYEVIADRKDEACNYNKKGKKKLKEGTGKYGFVVDVWGQTEEDPHKLADEYDLSIIRIGHRGDETLYKFVGKIEDINRAKKDGYFYSEMSSTIYESLKESTTPIDDDSILTYNNQIKWEKYIKNISKDLSNYVDFDYIDGYDTKSGEDIRGLKCDGSLTYKDALDILIKHVDNMGYTYSLNSTKAKNESIDDVTIGLDDQNVRLHSGEDNTTTITLTKQTDSIAPIPDDMKRDIEMRSEEENSEEEAEENSEDSVDIESKEETKENKEDRFVDVDVNEFDEESFDKLGESFLKNVYNNVDSFKTTEVSSTKNNIFVEGLIKFTSGNEKKTRFVFEAKDISKRGKIRFYGMNENFAKSRKPFTVTGKVNEGKFISESMNYNYMTKVNGESKRICGSVSLKEEKKRLDRDLSTVKGSMTSILQDYIGKMEGKTKEEIVADVEKLFKDNNLDTQASRKKLAQLRAAKNSDEAMFIISSSVLYGSNLGV